MAYCSGAGTGTPSRRGSVAVNAERREQVPDAGVDVRSDLLEDGVAGACRAARRGGIADAPGNPAWGVGGLRAWLQGPVAQGDHVVPPAPVQRGEVPGALAGDVDAEPLVQDPNR